MPGFAQMETDGAVRILAVFEPWLLLPAPSLQQDGREGQRKQKGWKTRRAWRSDGAAAAALGRCLHLIASVFAGIWRRACAAATRSART